MKKNDMVETAEAYYDGTLDEEDMEESESDVSDEKEADGDESYFDLDDDDEVEDSEEDETDDVVEEEEAESDEESDEEAEEGKDDPKGNDEKAKGRDELEEAVKEFLGAFNLKSVENLPEKLKDLTAEALGITRDEYDRRIAEKRAQAESWEAQIQRDIDEIHAAFPVTKKYKTLRDLPNKELFARLMDDKNKNLSAVAAFAASHPDIVKAHSNAPARNSDLKGTKDHIKSNVPKGAKDTSTYISKGDMETYREMFPGLSDKEIKRLFKSTNN